MRALHKEENGPSKWRGGDKEDRLDFIRSQKMQLGGSLQRVLDLSSKRTTFAASSKEDMPYLEFTQVFKPLHTVSLF